MTRKSVRRLLAALLAALLPVLGAAAAAEAAVETVAPFALGVAPNEAAPEVCADFSVNVSSRLSLTVCAGDAVEALYVRAPLASLTSDDGTVARVADCDLTAGTACIEAVAPGKAKLTGVTVGRKKCVLNLTVVAPDRPTAVKLTEKRVSMLSGETHALVPVFTPATARPALTWTSSKPAIASVDDSGVVTAIKGAEGSAKITAKAPNGKKASVAVKVKNPNKPQSIRFEPAAVSVPVGGTLTLAPVLTPATAETAITWKSSKPKVVSVDENGTLTALTLGKAKITATTANKKKATCAVTVTRRASAFRALLVGNNNFFWATRGWERTRMNANAVDRMAKALSGVSGPIGQDIRVTVHNDLDYAGLVNAIQSTFADAGEDDISLFYFASHGDSKRTDDNAGALAMASLTEEPVVYMKLSALADLLAAVPGRVIVILDTCGSGAGVYANSDGAAQSCADFDAAVIRAFREADPGVEAPADGVAANTGELRVENKFYVLCSSKYLEQSWAYGGADGGGSYFTDWLLEGVGHSGSIPADKKYAGNRDGAADLYELFKYVSAVGDERGIYGDGRMNYQHVQVYPSDTRFIMFR